MGLLTILKKVKAKEKELRILILGLDNAGKTTIMKRVTGGDHHEISPTGKQIKHFKKKFSKTTDNVRPGRGPAGWRSNVRSSFCAFLK